jgi:hypothetical protein
MWLLVPRVRSCGTSLRADTIRARSNAHRGVPLSLRVFVVCQTETPRAIV